MPLFRRAAEVEELRAEKADVAGDLSDALGKIASLQALADMNGRTLDAYRSTIDELREQVGIIPYVQDILSEERRASDSGELDFAARDAAVGVIRQRIHDQTVGSLADEMLTNREKSIRDSLPKPDLDRTRAEWDEIFTHDGTYAGLNESVLKDVDDEIKAELLEERRREICARLDTPKERNTRVAAIKETAAFQTGVIAMELRERTERMDGWQKEARQQAMADIDNRLEAIGASRIKELAVDWLNSESSNKDLDEKIAPVIDAILTLFIENSGKLPPALIRERFLKPFNVTGVSTSHFREGQVLKIVMTDADEDEYGYDNQRTLKLLALGDGKFLVKNDKIDDDDYYENDTIPKGTVIHIGRQIIDAGKKKFEEVLTKGMVFCYDNDKSTKGYKVIKYEIDEIIVDKISSQSKETTSEKDEISNMMRSIVANMSAPIDKTSRLA